MNKQKKENKKNSKCENAPICCGIPMELKSVDAHFYFQCKKCGGWLEE